MLVDRNINDFLCVDFVYFDEFITSSSFLGDSLKFSIIT